MMTLHTNTGKGCQCDVRAPIQRSPDRDAAGLRRILEFYPFFGKLRQSVREEIARTATLTRIAKGACFCIKDQVSRELALIGNGNIRVYTVDESGREITLYNVGPGDTCPINVYSVMLKRPVTSTACTGEDIEAVCLPAEAFRNWVARESVIRDFAFEAIAHRFEHVIGLVEKIAFRRLDERLTEFLRCRFTAVPGGSPAIRITHEQIAAELGSSREVISRMLRSFEHRGVVTLGRGRITLCDNDFLERARSV
jgi:CRP/FNR family transcriptional regulator